jgi:hypothetical protein
MNQLKEILSIPKALSWGFEFPIALKKKIIAPNAKTPAIRGYLIIKDPFDPN